LVSGQISVSDKCIYPYIINSNWKHGIEA